MGYVQNNYRVATLSTSEHSVHRNHSTNWCCRFVCCIISILVVLVIAIGITTVALYLIFQPKLPKYSVDQLKITALTLNPDTSLDSQFHVRITANNPNEKIGIYYEKQSHISVWYKRTELCTGSLPVFYQEKRNTTKLEVGLRGHTKNGNLLMKAIQEQQESGRIPLELKVDVPVRIKLGKLKVRKVRIVGTCLLTVDSLSTNDLITINASNCKFKTKL